MPNTYTQLHIQFVFAVKYRKALIAREWNEQLHKYMTAIFQDNKHKMLQINSEPDHIHILIGLRPHQSISSLMQLVKGESSCWLNEKRFCNEKFAWQEGSGAFSYAKNQVQDVIKYIQNQESHHKKESFLEEYKKILIDFDIDWKEDYIFKPPL